MADRVCLYIQRATWSPTVNPDPVELWTVNNRLRTHIPRGLVFNFYFIESIVSFSRPNGPGQGYEDLSETRLIGHDRIMLHMKHKRQCRGSILV